MLKPGDGDPRHRPSFARILTAVAPDLIAFQEIYEHDAEAARGTVAEILGPRELERDIGTRLFKFRRDLEQEFRYYHPRGVEIIGAYVEGINAYVRQSRADPSLLPVEFELR